MVGPYCLGRGLQGMRGALPVTCVNAFRDDLVPRLNTWLQSARKSSKRARYVGVARFC